MHDRTLRSEVGVYVVGELQTQHTWSCFEAFSPIQISVRYKCSRYTECTYLYRQPGTTLEHNTLRDLPCPSFGVDPPSIEMVRLAGIE